MTSLPQTYPRLALHLTDRTHTPFISTPISRSTTTSASSSRRPAAPAATFSRTPRANPTPPSIDDQLTALQSLTMTSLTSHDAALRLGLGLPTRIMVEHGPSGPVVLTSYIRAKRKPSPLTPSLSSATPVATASTSSLNVPATEPSSSTRPSPSRTNTARSTRSTQSHHTNNKPDPPAPQPPQTQQQPPQPQQQTPQKQREELPNPSPQSSQPILLSLVVSPSPDDLPDARRAASRLERVGRELQLAIAAEDRELYDSDDDDEEESKDVTGVVEGITMDLAAVAGPSILPLGSAQPLGGHSRGLNGTQGGGGGGGGGGGVGNHTPHYEHGGSGTILGGGRSDDSSTAGSHGSLGDTTAGEEEGD